MEVVKIIQWDMGHRVMNHRSICKGLHGHRYKAEISIKGDSPQKTIDFVITHFAVGNHTINDTIMVIKKRSNQQLCVELVQDRLTLLRNLFRRGRLVVVDRARPLLDILAHVPNCLGICIRGTIFSNGQFLQTLDDVFRCVNNKRSFLMDEKRFLRPPRGQFFSSV